MQQQTNLHLISQGLIHYPIRYAFDNNCMTEKQAALKEWFDMAELCYLSNAAAGTTTRVTRVEALTEFFKRSKGKYCEWADMQIEALLPLKPKLRMKRFDSFYVAMMKDPYPDCNPCRDTLSAILGNIDKQRARYQQAMKIQMNMQEAQYGKPQNSTPGYEALSAR